MIPFYFSPKPDQPRIYLLVVTGTPKKMSHS